MSCSNDVTIFESLQRTCACDPLSMMDHSALRRTRTMFPTKLHSGATEDSIWLERKKSTAVLTEDGPLTSQSVKVRHLLPLDGAFCRWCGGLRLALAMPSEGCEFKTRLECGSLRPKNKGLRRFYLFCLEATCFESAVQMVSK